MTRASIAALLWLAPALAAAQIPGVPVDSLTPPQMERVEVDVPEYDGHGVRLWFAPTGAPRATLRVDVLVASSGREAADAAAWLEQTVAGELAPLPGLGDDARGDASIVAFVRDNVFVVVQRVGEAGDARVSAAGLDAAIQAAPRRSAPRAPPIAVPALAEGTTLLQLPAAILAAHVVATGSASARRTRAGWVLVRRGAAPWTVTVVATDALLRRSRVEASGR